MRDSRVIGSIAFFFSLVLGQWVAAQGLPPLEPDSGVVGVDAATLRLVVTGRVCLPDGSPAVGAVVATSEGGEIVTGADGSFALEVRVPLDAESVEVSAILDEGRGSGSLVATARIVPAALTGTTPVGTLLLSLSPRCYSGWVPTFGEAPGTDWYVNALAVFDAGAGPLLYAAGDFSAAGSLAVSEIASWNGANWSALDGDFAKGLCDSCTSLSALAVHDDGSGSALYVGGYFTSVGGVATNYIAKWDGAGWSALAGGMNGWVRALAVYDDGGGPALYAAGSFTTADGVTVNRIAKWDGASWSALASGMNNNSYVRALVVYDDGSGPALCAGGDFTTAGGVTVNRIAKWDGSSWSALGSGISGGVGPNAKALAVYDDGSGPALYVGGTFLSAGGVAANHIARWNGSGWTALGSGMSNWVSAFTVHDDASGPALYAGGYFLTAGGVAANRVAKWDGSSWSAQGSGMNDIVLALGVYDDGSGPALHAGGQFTTAGSMAANRITKWDGSSWATLGGGGLNGAVKALTVHDDGSGPALHAAGEFVGAGGVTVNNVVKGEGSNWLALGSGMNAPVYALAVFDDGGGPDLYAGGEFTTALSGGAANRIARWNGSNWSRLGNGLTGNTITGYTPQVRSLAVFDDGSGPALYVAGAFSTAGSTAAKSIAKWNGSSWAALGNGIDTRVNAIAVYDDGAGAALYIGGCDYVWKWDGSLWSALGSGVNNCVNALAVYDDGTGAALYAAGEFTMAGGVTASKIAKWDGSTWSGLDSGISGAELLALTVHDDGGGPELYAGGRVGRRLLKWDGTSWTTLGLGLSDAVAALASWDDGLGAALYVGGDFARSPAGDSYLAKWGCRPKDTVKRRKL